MLLIGLALPFRAGGYKRGQIISSFFTALLPFGIWRDELHDGAPWPLFAEYFPSFVVLREYLGLEFGPIPTKLKAAEEKPESQFIFAVFPHGCGSEFRVLMEGMLHQVFPNLAERGVIRTLAASVLFRIPLLSHISLWTGCVDANRKTAGSLLDNGRTVIVLPGGEAEQLLTVHGEEKVYLKSRKGFVKLAMRKRVPIVPVYVFGCSDYFMTSTILYNVRHTLMKKFGICIPLCRGLYHSLCPLPVKTTIVFGEPIDFFNIMGKEDRQATEEELSVAHTKFCMALVDLFDKHKARLGYANRTLKVM